MTNELKNRSKGKNGKDCPHRLVVLGYLDSEERLHYVCSYCYKDFGVVFK